MKEVELIEKVLGCKYGVVPKVIQNTWLNRYVDLVKFSNFKLVGLIYGPIVAALINQTALYGSRSHSIWVPPKKDKRGIREYATLHELGHAWVGQRSEIFRQSEERFAEECREVISDNKELPRCSLESYLILTAVNEGIAHYVAIEAQKLYAQYGTHKHEIFAYSMEWLLANKKKKSLGNQRFNESTQLCVAEALSLPEETEKFIDYVLKIGNSGISSDQSNRQFIRRGLDMRSALLRVSALAEVLGYYLVKPLCDRSKENLGATLDKLIADPPSNLADYSGRLVGLHLCDVFQ